MRGSRTITEKAKHEGKVGEALALTLVYPLSLRQDATGVIGYGT